MILIIDYGVSNIKSVVLAIREVSPFNVVVSNNPRDIRKADKLILPGVCSYKSCIDNLERINMVEPLREQVLVEKKTILGICVGMQVFSTKGYENGVCGGLDIVKGEVIRLQAKKVPHMGWNKCVIKKQSKIFEGGKGNFFYFAHSYHFVPENKNVISSVTYYETEMTATIEKDNVFGCQFHPERSGKEGLDVLRRFCNLL